MRATRFDARMLFVAYLFDLLVGDSPRVPHPVRAIGAVATTFERVLRRATPATPRSELIAGGVLWATVTATTWAATRATLRSAKRLGMPAEVLVNLWLAQTTLATRNLLDEVYAVERALEQDDLPLARVRLARVVGRDTADLDHSEIARAAIETLAESLCDGVIAPLCALAVFGIPGAMAFKAISTLDSMIGHPEPPYTFFGRAAARADDMANYVPARTAALFIAAAATSRRAGGRALRMCFRDGGLHASPNAGRCEAAMAGALGVRLGGVNRYDGIVRNAPPLGAEFRRPAGADIPLARRFVFAASLMGMIFAVVIRSIVR
ncbi:MAG TPA: adenosylcobinamide-phosphate synthase CbiB [Candidatus Acidoferrales bacterium]|nr:adenosylcobinamide-phosphate synthase CbiB [Candidatus Acidoferrales bacterium]